MVMDKKRPLDETTRDASEWEGGSAAAGHDAKRRRVGSAGFGLGTFAGLVGKAFRATASVFGGGSVHQR